MAELSGWRRALLALLCGAAATAALPPLHLLPLLAVAFTALVFLLDGAGSHRARFLVVWWFAYGHFVAGLYWTGVAFLVDPERYALLLPFPILGLPAVLALFPALAVALAWARAPTGAARILLLGVGWSAAEYARGFLFTGFPWNLTGYVWGAFEAPMQAAAWIGTYGLGFLTVLLAAAPALLAERRWRLPAALAAGLALVWAAGALRLAGAEVAELPGVRLRLVQAGIDQYMKWQEDRRAENLQRHVTLSGAQGPQPVTHIVWPETAVPYFIDLDLARRAQLARLVPDGGLLLVGAPRRTPPDAAGLQVWNSLQAIAGDGEIVATYDKRHLVPFGEYLPLRFILGRIGLDKMVAGTVDFSSGDSAGVLDLKGLPPARVLICYEGIFPTEIVPAEGPRPGWLLNITNDGWFGRSSGPHQHFDTLRFRAVEQGLPAARAANTGISAIIDPYGRVTARLGLGETGVVDGPLPRALPQLTPYARFGEAIALALLLLAAAAAALLPRLQARAGARQAA